MKSATKHGTKVTLNHSWKVATDSNKENTFSHKSILTNIQVLKHRKALATNSSANIKLWKTQLHEIVKSGRFLRRL